MLRFTSAVLRAGVVVAPILVALGIWFVVRSSAGNETRAELNRLVAEAKGGSSRVVDVRDATDFDWDAFFVFGPYTDTAAIERTLGFEWDDADAAAPSTHDSELLLVFVDGHDVVNWFLHPDASGSDDDLAAAHCLAGSRVSSSDARLTLERVRRGGETTYVLVPAALEDRERRRFLARCGY